MPFISPSISLSYFFRILMHTCARTHSVTSTEYVYKQWKKYHYSFS